MRLQKLTAEFHANNNHLEEILELDKKRGYGIVVYEYNGLTFGIPLRSHISHKFGFITKVYEEVEKDGKKKIMKKGLDYSKALLLKKEDISDKSFAIPDDEFDKIRDSSYLIKKEFNKYVSHYVKGLMKSDDNILRSYKYSTLKNYNKQLLDMGIAQ